jgi:hypothetical protein
VESSSRGNVYERGTLFERLRSTLNAADKQGCSTGSFRTADYKYQDIIFKTSFVNIILEIKVGNHVFIEGSKGYIRSEINPARNGDRPEYRFDRPKADISSRSWPATDAPWPLQKADN